jgi:hypothetical protein
MKPIAAAKRAAEESAVSAVVALVEESDAV